MRVRDGLDEKERRMWGRVTHNIKPLNQRETEGDSIPESPSSPKSPERAEKPIVKRAVVKPPLLIVNRESERNIKRGRVRVEASCDLHDLSVNAAHNQIRKFVRQNRLKGCRCVLIITGKGHNGEGKIRRTFRLWLETEEAKQLISGYSTAHVRHGGAGAFYLFLRRTKLADNSLKR